jgi:glycosyltransferase involved in cell wall biosynthesis
MIADFPAPGVKPVGGPQVAVTRLVSSLVRKGVSVVVVAPVPGGTRETVVSLENGATLVSTPSGTRWTLARGLRPWRRRVRGVVRWAGGDVVHGQGLIPGGIAAGDNRDHPRVVTARGNLRQDTIAEYGWIGGMTRGYLRDRLAAAAAERADVVIGVNPDWAVNVPRRPRRFVYIPNIIDERFFSLRWDPEPGLVLFAGGTRAIKGWPLLAQAWPRVRQSVPEARLNVSGWLPNGEPPQIHPEQRQSLIIEGWLSSAELAERMRQASVLVIPSKFEVSPIVLAEAWALGLPVVTTPVGGLRSLAPGAAVVVPRNPEALADGIIKALSRDREVVQLVAEGRRRADAHRADAVADAHLALYNELIGRDRK